jgi:hypothetical protein
MALACYEGCGIFASSSDVNYIRSLGLKVEIIPTIAAREGLACDEVCDDF